MSKGRVEFTEDDVSGDIIMSTPYYDAGFVKEFKEVVPYTARRNEDGRGWDQEDQVWIFDPDYRSVVSKLAASHFGSDSRVSRLEILRNRR